MKNFFIIILVSLFTFKSYSQLQKANKFAKTITAQELKDHLYIYCLLYTSPSPRDNR